ncbi:hypothetical protein BG004_001536 [Podila humilis]|nr:hypothetical protein BG004_001536 [Podila humilis]
MEQFVPGRICYLSIDGPAPLAKMLTQKARRMSKSKSKSKGMSTLQATPGCPFMTRLEKYLSYYTVRYLQQRRYQGISPDLKFVIDHSNNPGEGEGKIIENILQQASNIRGRPCAIISMDSDAILQAIALGMPNIHVVRKDGHGPGIIVSIDNFMHELEQIFPGESNRVRLDFSAICMFRGNDYLRGMAVGLERLWMGYLYTKLADREMEIRKTTYLIDADIKTFDLYFLRQLMMNSEKSSSMLQIPERRDIAKLFEPVETKMTFSAGKSEEQEVYGIQSDKESVEDIDSDSDASGSDSDEVLDTLEPGDKDEDEELRILDVKSYSVQKYLVGVLWNLEMYCSGRCPDISYVYDFQYAPPRRAISEFVTALENSEATRRLTPVATSKILESARSNQQYPHPLVCALVLIPSSTGAKYLPASVEQIHKNVDTSQRRYLTFDEMQHIDAKVKTTMDTQKHSKVQSDKIEAKLISELYLTRHPYIWTRIRVPYQDRAAAIMPQSPTVVLKNLALASKPEGNGKPFFDLQPQPDIICSFVKVSPSSQDSRDIVWAVHARQKTLASEGKHPAKVQLHWHRRQQRRGPPGRNNVPRRPTGNLPTTTTSSPHPHPPSSTSPMTQKKENQGTAATATPNSRAPRQPRTRQEGESLQKSCSENGGQTQKQTQSRPRGRNSRRGLGNIPPSAVVTEP